jgi:hypothetical protein
VNQIETKLLFPKQHRCVHLSLWSVRMLLPYVVHTLCFINTEFSKEVVGCILAVEYWEAVAERYCVNPTRLLLCMCTEWQGFVVVTQGMLNAVTLAVRKCEILLNLRDFRLTPEVDTNCVLLRYYVSCGGNSFPNFWDNLSFPISRTNIFCLKIGPIGCTETR